MTNTSTFRFIDPDVKSGLVRAKIFIAAKGLMNIKAH